MLALWEAVLQRFCVIVIPNDAFVSGVKVSVSVGVSVGEVFDDADVYDYEYICVYMRMSFISVSAFILKLS